MRLPKTPGISWKTVLVAVILLAVVSGFILWLPLEREKTLAGFPGGNQGFRDSAVQFVRAVAESYPDEQPMPYAHELKIRGDWRVHIAVYHQGEIKGEGEAEEVNTMLSLVLAQATRNALEDGAQDLTGAAIAEARFLVSLPDRSISFIEYDREGRELIENLVITRSLDKELLLKKIEQGKEFLLRAVNEDVNGFYRKYDTLNDDFGDRVHTVYTASIIYTLLKINDFDGDERIQAGIADWAEFLLSMQSKDEKAYGAFHYSYYFESREKEPRFVVGTSALSIFTLLDLHQRTGEARYLDAAKLAGNWLVTMQKDDGWMKPYKEYRNGNWVCGVQKSLLYNGQVLASLSRLYGVTGEQEYYDTAERIARNFTERIEKEGCYLGDDYRSKNPISSAWVIMSLMDFYKVNQDDYYRDIILRCSSDIVSRQQLDTGELLSYGTWQDAYSTSGNGWLDEVVMELYEFCREQNMDGCTEYKEAAIRVTWWIMQNTYSAENTFFLEEPQKAIGGSFWNHENLYVRTDSICHAVNAYIALANEMGDGELFSIPDDPF